MAQTKINKSALSKSLEANHPAKIFVLDTNVLIHNPMALFAFGNNHVVIPLVVIEEIDNFKKGLDEKGRNARQIGRFLDNLRDSGSLKDGVPSGHGGTIQVCMLQEINDIAHKLYFKDPNDNLIIGTAVYFDKLFPNTEVILVSKDANVRIKADALGIKAQNYENETVSFDELYTGISNLLITKKQYEQFENEHYLLHDKKQELHPNEYVRLKLNNEPNSPHLLGRYYQDSNMIYPLAHYKEGSFIFGINARNEEQSIALDLLLDDSIKMVSLIGKAGTGKTLLAMAAGLELVVTANKYSRLVVSRPIFPMGKDLGFLPGSKADKFNPWMQPIYDNMEILLTGHHEHEENKNGKIFGKKTPSLQDYLDYNFVELEPLTYIRGRSLPNQFIIIDESQNLTPHEMKTIITRAGEGTKVILTGDPYQIDIPYLDSESNGLSMCAELLKNEPLVGHITLEKGERSILADLAAKYF